MILSEIQQCCKKIMKVQKIQKTRKDFAIHLSVDLIIDFIFCLTYTYYIHPRGMGIKVITEMRDNMKKHLQSYLYWALLTFLIVGIFYPAIGLLAIICMLAPVVVSFFKGRYWCGNFCPRGSFYDHILGKFSPQKPIPDFFRTKTFRFFVLLMIMTAFSLQMYFAWGDLEVMGTVFLRVILLTTLLGIVLGVVYHQRTWCAFCPMGSLASWIAEKKKPMPLMVSDSCINCKLCAKVCPMQLAPYKAKGSTLGFEDADCLKCGRCVQSCPKQVLSFNK